ncbi:hypothetical protein BU26DRAFT_389162, partial [Trematosphaeria pertusa]
RVSHVLAHSFGSAIVTICVGEGERQQNFAVHKNVICARSGFLKDATAKETLQLPDQDPRAFNLYMQLLYTDRLPCKPVDAANCDEYTLLCKLYILVKKLQDVPAKNAALDALLAKSREADPDNKPCLPSSEHLRIIYNGTSGTCGARRLMVDLYTFRATGQWMTSQGGSFPQEFMADLA